MSATPGPDGQPFRGAGGSGALNVEQVRRVRLLRPGVASDAVARPRLLAALDRGLKRPLIVLPVAAGFGKTTLLCQWLSARDLPAAWVSLDERVSDLAAVAAHIVAALQGVAPGAGGSVLALLQLPRPAPAASLGEALADDLLDLPRDTVLVLDDYHTVTDPAVHALLEALLAHPPPRLHLALLTRVDPPLPLAQLMAHGQLLALRGADLRFTSEEARDFLTRTVPGGVDDATAALLEAQTEGWAAGLRLAVLSLEPAPAPVARGAEARARTAADPGLRRQGLALDFLLDDVLARQPPAVQEFLLRTSIVERFCASLAGDLLEPEAGGEPAAAALLQTVVRSNLFVSLLDASAAAGDGRPAVSTSWYRYHQLFRAALLQRLVARVGPQGVAALRRRAGAWLGARGMVDDAVRQAVAAGDGPGAAMLVEAHARAAFNQDDWTTVEGWLAQVPPAEVARRPALVLAHAWVTYLRGHYTALPPLLAAAGMLLHQGEDAAPGREAGPDAAAGTAWLGEIDALSCVLLLQQNDVPAALAAARRALARLPADRQFVRGVASNYLGATSMTVEGPATAVRRLNQLLVESGGGRDACGIRVQLALVTVLARAGALEEAAEAATRAARLSADLRLPASAAGAEHRLGAIAYARDDLPAAEAHFRAVLDGAAHAHLFHLRESTMGLALIRQAQGRPGEARAEADRLVDLLVRSDAAEHLRHASALQTRLALLRGDLVAVQSWLGAADAPTAVSPMVMVEDPALVRAWALVAAGTPESLREATVYLEALRVSAVRQHLTWWEVRVLALQAVAAAARGEHAAALAATAAVALGRPGGFVRPLADLGPPAAALLRETVRRCPADAYLRRLAAAASGPAAVAPLSPSGARAAPPPAPAGQETRSGVLTEREAEVLDCLARRLSDKEISAELRIAGNTVKRHAGNIYTKLGVATRRQAVRRATELGLLGVAG